MQEVKARDVFAGMKENFDAQAAGDMTTVISYELSGEDGGTWTLRVGGGKLEVDEGLPSGTANAAVSMSAEDFVKVAKGELSAMNGFMSGRIKIKGDLMAPQKLQSLFKKSE